jgi:hypothetical protein
MAVMVTLTIKTDVATYRRLHEQMLTMARSAGLLFHSGREVPGGIAVVDFWPSEEAFQKFSAAALAEGMRAAGLAQPDDLKITPVLSADGR